MAVFRRCAPRRTEHTRVLHAPPRVLYDVVAAPGRWPAVLGPVVHARARHCTAHRTGCEVWAREDGGITTWRGTLTADPARHYLGFRWEAGALPVPVAGSWYFRPLPGDRTEVVLRHRFPPGDGPRTDHGRVRRTLERRGREQLDALAKIAALAAAGPPAPVLAFTDTFPVPGTAADCYDFVRRADRWAERLPHVVRSTTTGLHPQVDAVELDTAGDGGLVRRTRAVRVCHDSGWIAHKELVTARPVIAHTALWTFTGAPHGTLVTVDHTVLLDPAAVPGAFGHRASPRDVRAGIHRTLRHAAFAVLAGVHPPPRPPRTAKAS